jgi:beta-glucosidase-like glycosyl hydrolase
MSIITDALKMAAEQEKTISKQEAEIAALKAKVDSLTWAKAAANEVARLAKDALKNAQNVAKASEKQAKKEAKDALGIVQAELKEVKAQLKAAQKTPKAAKPIVSGNDVLGQVKRKPGRPKKAVAELPAIPEVDPRQIPIPDLGSPYVLEEPIAPENIPQYDSPGVSTKGINYEFV